MRTISKVNEEFMKLINGQFDESVRVGYWKKSANDYTEADDQSYPCVVIQDYAPTMKEDWYIDQKKYFTPPADDAEDGYEYHRPLWLSFRFDVSVCSKRYSEFMAMKDVMYGFVGRESIKFNRKDYGIFESSDIIPCRVTPSDSPREDGVFETNFEFELSVWCVLASPEEVSLIQNVNITLNP